MTADGSCKSDQEIQFQVPAATYELRAQQARAATRAALQAAKANSPSSSSPSSSPSPSPSPAAVPPPSIDSSSFSVDGDPDPDAPADWSIFDRPAGWTAPLLDPTPPTGLRFELSDQEKAFSAQIKVLLEKQMQYDKEAREVIPASEPVFYTIEELAEFNGVDPKKPIYVSMRKKIYDVTLGRKYYAPGEKYSYLSGKEVARAFATGCYETTGLTYDVRGLDREGQETVKHWTEFYGGKYRVAGKLNAPKINKDDPLPDDNCEERDRYGKM